MSGILVIAFCRTGLAQHLGEVATASVACGVGGFGGNKGGAALTFTLFRRRFVVVSSHFAAHQARAQLCATDAIVQVRLKITCTVRMRRARRSPLPLHV